MKVTCLPPCFAADGAEIDFPTMKTLGVLAVSIMALVRAAESAVVSEPKIALMEPRVWSCDFESVALARPMRFLVVLPEGTALHGVQQPVIYFFHGLGRNECTLLEQDATRPRVLDSTCVIVLPRGLNGWYINSPGTSSDRYADYVDEVIALSERYFPVGSTAPMRAIGGWSMGGYGAAYTACRRAGEFAALAPIIGILDFPRRDVPEPLQHYMVANRFGTDPVRWADLNPRSRIAQLRGTQLFVAYADMAPECQMNEIFIADARANRLAVEVLRMSGGHTFPMVAQGLGPALTFLERALSRGRERR
jgi:S-formylglutathione hydrolase FrmB